MKNLKIDDLLAYNFLSGLEISPDKKTLAYLSTKANLKENSYDNMLYVYDLNKEAAYKVSQNKNISLYDFDMDGDLIFKEKSDDDFDYFYKKSRDMGAPELDFKLKLDVSTFKHLYDETYLVIATPKLSKEEKKKKKDENFFEEIKSLPYRLNGQGFLKFKGKTYYLYDRKKDLLHEIYKEKENKLIDGYDFTPDYKKLILLRSNENDGLMSLFEDLIVKDLESGEEKILSKNIYSFTDIFAYDDKILALASDGKKYGVNENPRLYEFDYDGGCKILKPDFDYDFGNSIGNDVRYGSCRIFEKTDDGFFAVITQNEKSKLMKIDMNGSLHEIIADYVEDFVPAKEEVYYFSMKEDSLNELKRASDGKTLLENKVNRSLGKLETFKYESNGDEITGFVLLPIDFDENKKYPALLSVHGGPKTEFADIFHHEHQVYANDGYFVIYTNPHGASGHGDAYSDIRGLYGIKDYEDLMTFVDQALERFPQIDPERLGVFGGSYGGFMTNRIIGHTDRFKAANSQRSISNRLSFHGVSDIGFYFADDQTAANPRESCQKMRDLSPLKYAKNVKTPTLFIHSDCDYRCPLEQGLQMYTAIKENGVKTKLYLFHDENHELSRSGKPKGRIKRMEAIKSRFDTYLKEK